MKNARIMVVIFDMDGVLIDSEPIHMEIERYIFQALGIHVTPQEHENMVGMSPKNTWELLKNKFGLKLPLDEFLQLELKSKYEELQKRELQPTPGVVALLSALKHHGFHLAVASSSAKLIIKIVLSKLQIDSYFDFIISGEQVAYSKPAPDIFLQVAEHFGHPPATCVVIEDSYNGLKAAHAASMKCIGYVNPNSGKQDLSSADLLIDTFATLTISKIIDLQNL